jgi:hypothetical protein
MGLREIPVQLKIDSEEDLRAMVISYCSELGFDSDEISCEDHFSITLGHTSVLIDKKSVGGRSDILISRCGKPLAIIETKAPSHNLIDDDAKQAISYARLLATIAPFAIVTNGTETRVYDVLADGLTRVDNPQESLWNKNRQQLSGINDELKYEAAKLLIAINPETLRQFCERQVATGLNDLKSDVKGNKKYNPELYVERDSLNKTYSEWVQSERPVFAIVAPSGYGKTNFMCAKAEETKPSHFALFYSAGRFTDGLVSLIRNDFIWEFHRDRELVHIFDRLNSIAQNAEKKLLIFVDAIDENPSGLKAIKNELRDIVSRLRPYPNIKLVLSCKLFDWPHVVVDDNQSFNLLAETINPSLKQPDRRLTTPNAEQVGFHFDEFTNQELDEAIAKYKTAYSMDGDFYGEIREESHNPLMLRFIAEIYGTGKEQLPTSISSRELFELYLIRKLAPIVNQNIGENILSKVASLVFLSGKRSIPKDEIISDIRWSESYETAFQDWLRLGVLSKTHSDEEEVVGFEFNKFLLYYYVFKVKKVRTLQLDSQISLIKELLQTPIGTEAVEFYLVAANQEDVHKLLMELASQDLPLFSQLIAGLKSIDTFKKSPIPLEHVVSYLEFYNFLRSKYFNQLALVTMPYDTKPLGVVFFGDFLQSFRACTPAYPQDLVRVDNDELAQQFFKGLLPKQVIQDLMPVGNVHIGGIHEFAEYPQKASYKHLLGEVSSTLSNRLLDESSAQDILRERVYEILLHQPSYGLVGDNLPHEKYWKCLGYNKIDELATSKVSEITNRVKMLFPEFKESAKKDRDSFHVYQNRQNELLAALFALSQMVQDVQLGLQKYSIDKMQKYIDGDSVTTKLEFEQLLPTIIENYKEMFIKNFPFVAEQSPFFINIDKLAIVEMIRLGRDGEFPKISYVVCPQMTETAPTKVVSTPYTHSLTGGLKYQNLHSGGHYVDSAGGKSGYIELDTIVDGVRIQDPHAWVVRTPFKSRTIILEQVYSLIAHDLRYLLHADHANWKDDITSNLANGYYLQLAAKSLQLFSR